MATETVPADIAARIAALLAFERDVAMLPGSAVAKRSRDRAREALDAAILTHLRKADELKAALERITSGGV